MAGIVLITGGAGFIGSHLAKTLVAQGRVVRILDNYEPQVHSTHQASSLGFEVVKGDVTDSAVWEKSLVGVTHVVHFAAAVGVGQSMYEIPHYCHTNVMGTAYMLEAVAGRKHTIVKLLVASSMSVYGEGLYWCNHCDRERSGERTDAALRRGEWEPSCSVCNLTLTPRATHEGKVLRPASVYAINKRDQEEMCLVVGRAYGIPTVALRFFNVYGPGQSLSNPYTGVTAIFAGSLLAKSEPLVFEDGKQTRDFVHVTDVANACSQVLARETVTDTALNVGTGRATSVGELAKILHQELGGPAPKLVAQFRAGDVRHCFADVSAIKEQVGWEPTISVEDGMKELLQWLRSQKNAESRLEQAYSELRTHGLVI